MTAQKYLARVVRPLGVVAAAILLVACLAGPNAFASRPPNDDDHNSNSPPATRGGRSLQDDDRRGDRQPRRDFSPPRDSAPNRSYALPGGPRPVSPPPTSGRLAPDPTFPTFRDRRSSVVPSAPPTFSLPKDATQRMLAPKPNDLPRILADHVESQGKTKANDSPPPQVDQSRKRRDDVLKQADQVRKLSEPRKQMEELRQQPSGKLPWAGPPMVGREAAGDSLRGRSIPTLDSHGVGQGSIKPGALGTVKSPGDAKDEKTGKDVPRPLHLERTGPPEKKGDRPDLRGPAGGIGHPDARKLDAPPAKLHAGQVTTIKNLPIGPQGDIQDLHNVRFHDRLKSGQLDHITSGAVAQKIKLSEQFHMAEQGDVARRMELHKHFGGAVNVSKVGDAHLPAAAMKIYGNNPHHGLIGPHYVQSCFRFQYWGPGYFAGACWYPTWNPWVKWSWYHHCHPLWDPRPLWCRPIIYQPCPHWVWWQTPVWAPLPVVVCGTWVDVPPVAVVQQYDLQLLAVRFVDPGHPEQNLGPRYRVWYRNNSDQPLVQPFNVVAFAGNDDRLLAELPQAGTRVTAMEPGDVQSVDLRLPIEVYGMARDPQGNPAPFNVLHVLVDANREIPDTTWTNNGVHLPRADVLPVDPAAFEVAPQEMAAGGEVVLAGEGFGPRPGRVLVHMAGLELEGEILGWYDLGVRLSLPKVPLAGATEAEVIVIRGDGAAANPLQIRITPPLN